MNVHICSSWSDEVLVDYVIESVQKVMEEECDQYFKEISTVAVKVSHNSQNDIDQCIVLLNLYV